MTIFLSKIINLYQFVHIRDKQKVLSGFGKSTTCSWMIKWSILPSHIIQ